MKNVIGFIKSISDKIKSFFPSPLPVGLTEFQEWSNSIIELSKAPDNDSFRFAIASIAMSQLGPSRDRVSKHYVVKLLRKGMTNQVASAVMFELKEKQKLAEQAAKQTVATTQPLSVVQNVAQTLPTKNT